MPDERGQRQQERGEARERRRAPVEEPFQQLDDAAGAGGEGIDLKRALTTAAAAAVAGALAGGAKALLDKRSRNTPIETEAEQEMPDETPAEDAPAEDAVDVPNDDASDDEPAEADEAEDEAEEPTHTSAEAQPEGDAERTGASSDDVATIIARAKAHVEQVLGSEAESVSGVERANGSWRVSVEVVQMRRVPESTDVLASYAVVVDGDGDLISLQETRRYRRSQADGER
jgi:Gas vesicle synthesis protein GvpO